jgi:hypothetical protein
MVVAVYRGTTEPGATRRDISVNFLKNMHKTCIQMQVWQILRTPIAHHKRHNSHTTTIVNLPHEYYRIPAART